MPKGKEASARIKINNLLEKSGWRFFDSENGKANIELENYLKETDLGNDFEKTKKGFVDYLLLDENSFPVCVLEAKREEKHPLDGKEQARNYANTVKARYIILSNGNLHYFWDLEHGNPSPISTFPTPESLVSRSNFKPDTHALVHEAISDDYLITSRFPDYQKDPSWIDSAKRETFIETNKLTFLRPYQIHAIQALQKAVQEGKNRFLFEMATGTGKTTTCAAIIRLYLKTGNAKRVLFLVDRLELETQADKAFKYLLSTDYTTVIYKEKKNDWKKAEIVVTTIQSIMYENKYLNEFSPTDFDLIISDEAHRTINGEGSSRQVFDYFIGHKLGLTATPKDYLKNIHTNEEDPREIERRTLLSTYKTFGCENGTPTYSYTLLDGVKEGYLINPTVLDCRTDITTKLLAEEGYKITMNYTEDDVGVQQSEKIYKHTDFEKKFFSEKTNIQFALTFIQHALKDPISNEIGKTLVFCVSQTHARKITTILNELAERLYPGKYNSDFAMQVTSNITGAQEATINFTNNNLNGHTRWMEGYKSSRTRVCVTVGMMTTGYDCPDILNIMLLRPIFSPTDFVQVKGRGTRRSMFAMGKDNVAKHKFMLFDFFGNCEYFETKFNYDQKIELPKLSPKISISGPIDTGATGILDTYYSMIQDKLAKIDTIELGKEGMRIDRELFKNSFEQRLEEIKKTPSMQEHISNGDIEQIEAIVKEQVLDKPEEYLTMEKLRKAYPSDRKLSLREIIEHVLFGKKIASTEDKASEYFERFKVSTELPAETYYYIREFFVRYVIDPQFRSAVDTDSYGTYGSDPWMREVIKETGPHRSTILAYCKENVPLHQFT